MSVLIVATRRVIGRRVIVLAPRPARPPSVIVRAVPRGVRRASWSPDEGAGDAAERGALSPRNSRVTPVSRHARGDRADRAALRARAVRPEAVPVSRDRSRRAPRS